MEAAQLPPCGADESYLEHPGDRPGALRDHLVPAGDQFVTGQLHDRADTMGGLRWDRGCGGDSFVVPSESEATRRHALESSSQEIPVDEPHVRRSLPDLLDLRSTGHIGSALIR